MQKQKSHIQKYEIPFNSAYDKYYKRSEAKGVLKALGLYSGHIKKVRHIEVKIEFEDE